MGGGSRIWAWLRLFRFHFYPLSLVILTTGLMAGRRSDSAVDWRLAAWSALVVILLQMLTVVTNEIFDLDPDRGNDRFSFFNGGSRVLVDGQVSQGAARFAAAVLMLSVFALTALAVARLGAPPAGTLALVALGAVLGIGYTAPPLRLCYRGLGEVTVAFTYSYYLFTLGYYLAARELPEAAVVTPFCLPLFLAILPAIVAANVADAPADRRSHKRTWPVVLGPKAALRAALALSTAACAVWLRAWWDLRLHPVIAVGACLMAAHLVTQSTYTFVRWRRLTRELSTQGLVVGSLVYVLWFSLPPLVVLLEG